MEHLETLKVIRPLGLGLDEEAIAAVSKWHFAPGTKNGEPIDVKAQIKVNFRFAGKSKWHLQRVEFNAPAGAMRPILDKIAGPHVANDVAAATVTFDIDEKGAPVNVQIEKASDDEWARDATNALAKWRFIPASKDGVPVNVSCSMDFVRGN